jgi:hypothetical protein
MTTISRRIGAFKISRPLIEDDQYTQMVSLIFAKIKIIHCDFHYGDNTFHYKGICELFDETNNGEFVPDYELTFDSQTMALTAQKVTKMGAIVSETGSTVEVQALTTLVAELTSTIGYLKSELASSNTKITHLLNLQDEAKNVFNTTLQVVKTEVANVVDARLATYGIIEPAKPAKVDGANLKPINIKTSPKKA